MSTTAPSPLPLVDELRSLAAILPANFRVRTAETADVLGALIARAEHGPALVDAAKKGPQALADFFHDAITKDAADRNAPAPQKGQPVANVMPNPLPGFAGGVSRAELDQFKADIIGEIKNLLGAGHAPPAADEPAPDQGEPAAEGAPAADPPAHAGDDLGL